MQSLISCVSCGTGEAIMHGIPIFIRVLFVLTIIFLRLLVSHA